MNSTWPYQLAIWQAQERLQQQQGDGPESDGQPGKKGKTLPLSDTTHRWPTGHTTVHDILLLDFSRAGELVVSVVFKGI